MKKPSVLPRAPLVLALLFGGLYAASVPAIAQGQDQNSPIVADGIAAVVGDEIILRSEVNLLVQRLLRRSGRSYSPQVWQTALDELIRQQVLVETAQRDTTIQVSDTQVQQLLDRRFERIIQRAGSAAAVEAQYGKSIRQLKEQFRADFRKRLLAQHLRQRRMQEVQITPSEVRSWFEEIPQDSLPRIPETVRLAHIVRYPEPAENARQRARERITAIRDSILAGALTIAEAARRYSDDRRSTASGGLYQGFPLDDLEASFAAVAARSPIGEVSSVFETSRGFHILRVNERSGGTVSFNHVLIAIDEQAVDPSGAIRYLRAVRDSLLHREDLSFAQMARRHSQEERTSKYGGHVTAPQSGARDLILDRLDPSWQTTIDTLEVDQISRPTEVVLLSGERAYHVVKLLERTPAHRVSLATDYDRIRQYALRAKQQRVMQQWLAQLREDIYVDVRVDVPA